MATGAPEHNDALRIVRELVQAVGFCHVVYVLAQVADEHCDVAKTAGDTAHATRAAHDAKVLGEAAMRLLG